MAAEDTKTSTFSNDEKVTKRAREDDLKEIKDAKDIKKARMEEINKEADSDTKNVLKDQVKEKVGKVEEKEEEKKEEKKEGRDEGKESNDLKNQKVLEGSKDHTKDTSESEETRQFRQSGRTNESSESKVSSNSEGPKGPKGEQEGNEKTGEEPGVEKKQAAGKDKKESDKQVTPSFVFGATSSFGSGFKVTQKGSDGKSKEASPKASAFGSGLSFGNGFGVLKKNEKEVSTEQTPEKVTENVPELSDSQEKFAENSTESSTSSGQGVVKLQKQKVKSGEEAEETLYQANAKLYQYTNIKTGWKERGVGVIKVNKNVHTGKARLVMRSRGMLKVILNLSLVKGFTVQKGFVGSMQGEKFIRMVTQDDNKAPIQTAVKTSKQEIAEGLYESIVKLIPK